MRYLLLLLVIALFLPSKAQFNQSANTNSVSLCSCVGEVWNISTPYKPYVTFPAAGPSKRIMFTGYGFNIPLTATVTGIEASFTYSTVNTTTNTLRDTLVNLLYNGTVVGNSQASVTPAFANTGSVLVGSSNDTWGWFWNPTDINAQGFGLNFKVISNAAGAEFHFTYGASIRVYYDLPNGIKESQKQNAMHKILVDQKQLLLVTEQNAEISIYSILGNKLVSMRTEGGASKELNLSAYPTGLYVYSIKTQFGEQSGKFILN